MHHLTDRTDETNHSATRRRVLKTGAGALAAVSALPILSGTVAAHFPEQLVIDIKSGCADNPLSVQTSGVVPVAVLLTEFRDENGEAVTFDPTERDVRYRFGAPDVVEDGEGARSVHSGYDTDNGTLLLHFPMEETGFDGDETAGKLIWERDESGEHGYAGTDEITPTTGGDCEDINN